MRDLLLVAVVLACPLMMVFMMRGGHGHGRNHRGHEGGDAHELEPRQTSMDDLRRRREELDRLIEQREQSEEDTPLGYTGSAKR
jgi:hypothetical protein